MNFHDKVKNAKRHLRYVFLRMLTDSIATLPVSRLNKIKNLLLKILPLFFQGEMKRARELLPREFAGRSEEILQRMAENQVLNLLEIIHFENLIEAYPDYLRWEGLNILEKALEKKKGAILFTGHFGNWEMIGYALARKKMPLNVIARPQAVNRMTEFMNGFREKRGVRVLMHNNLSASLRLLRANQLIGIVSDLNARERGYRVNFFEREASFYSTPVMLSVRTDAPLIPVFIERESHRSQCIRVEPPIEWAPEETMTQRVRKYVERYEQAFRRRPDQWIWFHERYAHTELGRTD